MKLQNTTVLHNNLQFILLIANVVQYDHCLETPIAVSYKRDFPQLTGIWSTLIRAKNETENC